MIVLYYDSEFIKIAIICSVFYCILDLNPFPDEFLLKSMAIDVFYLVLRFKYLVLRLKTYLFWLVNFDL